jgi:hypothetical protein
VSISSVQSWNVEWKDNQKVNIDLFASILLKNDAENSAGFIINTGAWSESLGVPWITQIASKFKVDIICVVGHERLAVLLKQQGGLQEVQIVAIPKSGGVRIYIAHHHGLHLFIEIGCLKRFHLP